MNIAIVGATGNVGRKLLEVLEKLNFKFSELYLIASDKSVGKKITFVEVGVLQGGSLFMWREYFGKEARIIGIDLHPKAKVLEKYGKNNEETWSSITTNQGSVSHLDYLTDLEKNVFKTAFELDQKWIIELSGDRTPYISQSQSINLFLPADVHKRELHQIHFQAWKKGLKSLYYCRSKSIQRAENVNSGSSTDVETNVYKKPHKIVLTKILTFFTKNPRKSQTSVRKNCAKKMCVKIL